MKKQAQFQPGDKVTFDNGRGPAVSYHSGWVTQVNAKSVRVYCGEFWGNFTVRINDRIWHGWENPSPELVAMAKEMDAKLKRIGLR